MQLHRTETSDWDHLAPGKYNAWQRVAAQTNGIATPGNVISLLGALLVCLGLYFLTKQMWLGGILGVGLGRFADVLDGAVADATKTKSSFGEAVDASIDKILLGLTLLVLLYQTILPPVVGLFMAFHGAYNSILSMTAKNRGFELHPLATGKLGAVFEWLCVGLYVAAAAATEHHRSAAQAFLISAVACFAVFVVMAILSSVSYTKHFNQRRKPQ